MELDPRGRRILERFILAGVWRSKQKLVDSERAGLRLKGLDRLKVVILGGRNENKEFRLILL